MTFKRYLGYLLKKNLRRTAILSVAVIPIALFCSIDPLWFLLFGLNGLSLILNACAILIPVLELSPFKKKRNLDVLYSFPLNHTQMALAHYVSGLVQLFSIYTPSFLTTHLVLAANPEKYTVQWMPLYYLLSLIFGWVTYSVAMFLFNEGNTVIDGILFFFLGSFSIGVALDTVDSLILKVFKTSLFYYTHDSFGYLFNPLHYISDDISFFAQRENIDSNFEGPFMYSNFSMTHTYLVWIFLGLLAMIGFLLLFRHKKAEKAEGLSDSWFGYRTMIPLYGISFLMFYQGEYVNTTYPQATGRANETRRHYPLGNHRPFCSLHQYFPLIKRPAHKTKRQKVHPCGWTFFV